MFLIRMIFKPFLWFFLTLVLMASQAAMMVIPTFSAWMLSTAAQWIPEIKNPWRQIDDLKASNTRLVAENERIKAGRSKVKPISSRIARRLTRNVTMNVSSLALEAVPILGIATMIAVTAVDVNDACNTMDDMNQLLDALGEPPEQSATDEICGYRDKIPTVDELKEKISGWL